MIEEWRAVIGYEGYYEVSSLGQVRSIDRNWIGKINGRPFLFRKKGKILKQWLNRQGYPFVTLSKDQVLKSWRVHRLVALVFLEKLGEQVNHKNGDKLDNSFYNLEWCSEAENHAHAARHGLVERGTKRHNSVLNEDRVREIRGYQKWGFRPGEISEMMGLHRSTVCNVMRGASWAWLQ